MGDDGLFNVDVEMLIDEVKCYPEIWDFRSEAHKDRGKIALAWETIMETFIPDFHHKTEMEKNNIIRRFSLKWKNIRDNYQRSLRKLSSSDQPGGRKRQYLYAKRLTFLQLDMPSADTRASTKNIRVSTKDPLSVDYPLPFIKEEEFIPEYESSSGPATPSSSSGTGRSAPKQQQEMESSLIDFMKSRTCMEPPDADRSFFESLLPFIKNFTEDQKLEFRSEVLEVVKKIKKPSAAPPSSYNPVKS